jgi:hypothetical protein
MRFVLSRDFSSVTLVLRTILGGRTVHSATLTWEDSAVNTNTKNNADVVGAAEVAGLAFE